MPAQIRRTALNLIQPYVNDRTVLLTGSVAGSRHMARFMADAGARAVSFDLGLVPADTRAQFAACEQALARPTEDLRARLESVDPERTALVYAGSFTAATDLSGRRVIGARSARHLDVERKDRQHDLLGLGGDIVPLADGLDHLDLPAVVQGIPSYGVAMAASHTYLVPRTANSQRVRTLGAILAQDCSHAVVNAFNRGTPCTFYGFITATTIVNFGPVEALVYWDPHTWRIHAPGILRPIPLTDGALASARAEVAAVARRLHQRSNYIGAFGTDGVITEDDQYVIHEINPRVCAGFSLLNQLAPDAAPLAAVDLVLREVPDASTTLATPLTAVSTVLQEHPAPAYRLWGGPSETLPAVPDNTGWSAWSDQVRRTAANGRQPITEMKEPTR